MAQSIKINDKVIYFLREGGEVGTNAVGVSIDVIGSRCSCYRCHIVVVYFCYS